MKIEKCIFISMNVFVPVSFIQVFPLRKNMKSALAPSPYFNPIKGCTSSHSSYNESDLRERTACVYERMPLMSSNDSAAHWPFEFQGERPLPAEPSLLLVSPLLTAPRVSYREDLWESDVALLSKQPLWHVALFCLSKIQCFWQKSKEMLKRTLVHWKPCCHSHQRRSGRARNCWLCTAILLNWVFEMCGQS